MFHQRFAFELIFDFNFYWKIYFITFSIYTGCSVIPVTNLGG